MNICTGTPLFLEHSSRRLFALFLNANPDVPFQGSILHFPAFGEEMNKSRAMVLSQARALADEGYSVLVPDYYGTGDSSGEFSDASWELWLEDMRYCLSWLEGQSQGPVTLWGLRLGALMAVEVASELVSKVARLVLWNPVLLGEQYMLQFLRLRLVNSMMYGETKEKVADLMVRLEQDGELEVAGYELSVAMFREVSARKVKAFEFESQSEMDVLWVDTAPVIKSLPVPAQTLIDQWAAAGISVEVKQLAGAQFWGTQEITRADELIETTTHWLKGPHSENAELVTQ